MRRSSNGLHAQWTTGSKEPMVRLSLRVHWGQCMTFLAQSLHPNFPRFWTLWVPSVIDLTLTDNSRTPLQAKAHMMYVFRPLHYLPRVLTVCHRAQLKSFASINQKLADHNTVLDVRERALEGVQDSLIKEGRDMVQNWSGLIAMVSVPKKK